MAKVIFRIALLLAGLLNFAPILGLFFPAQIETGYGISAPDAGTLLLLRHRGLLFGIIGGFMIFSSSAQKNMGLATMLGMISMVGFILLFLIGQGPWSQPLQRVAFLDGVAILLLGAGWWVGGRKPHPPQNGSTLI